MLLCALLANTQFAEATCSTIRLRLLKLGTWVRVSVRRITFAMASAYPRHRTVDNVTQLGPPIRRCRRSAANDMNYATPILGTCSNTYLTNQFSLRRSPV
jgi:hypothetical protein